MTDTIIQNTYYFEGIRWIPGYRDFDYDDIEIVAKDTDEAWEILDKRTNKKTWKSVGLTTINNVRYYESV